MDQSSPSSDSDNNQSENAESTAGYSLGHARVPPSQVPEAPDIQPGTIIDDFVILNKIGPGGCGIVYKAQQRSVTREVALKLIRPDKAVQGVIERFGQEKNTLGSLNHPKIVNIIAGGKTSLELGNQHFFAMEYVDGQSITNYSDKHKLSVHKRLELFIQVCEAIEFAHKHEVIHRDIKPANILVAEDVNREPIVKVIDFGIAKIINNGLPFAFATQAGFPIGTPLYMSPEQAGEDPTLVDEGSDIYSLGVLLYELLIGCLPLEVEGDLEARKEIIRKHIPFPRCNRAMRDALIECCEFHWAKISPAVFGSLFQGVIDDRARRQQGAHYTSERDIMKVIRSLFLDDLRAELEQLKRDRSTRRRANLETYQTKLRSLKFLDPACGCGNFLVLGYRELRQLEIDAIRELHGTEQQELNVRDLCKVDVDQFYGLEYSEWPVRIAEVAMWLIDHQINAQAAEIFGQRFERLPLRASPHIVTGNALRTDWNTVLPREECSYVLGNPPFVGKKEQNPEQKTDMGIVWGRIKGAGVLDYVTCWYLKAARYIEGTRIPVAFVSTNSITQGEQVDILWGELFQSHHLKIHFAHRTFEWQSEARGRAHVHVVIIGFANVQPTRRTIFEYENQRGEPVSRQVSNISPYLLEGSDVTIPTRENRLSPDAPEMMKGSEVTDDGHLLLNDGERAALLNETPELAPYIRPFLGGKEYINGLTRWCLWLQNAPPTIIRQNPTVTARLEAVREFRLKSPKERTVELAAFPAAFGENRQPTTDYLLVPKVSSERRHYLPIGFLTPDHIVSGIASTPARLSSGKAQSASCRPVARKSWRAATRELPRGW